MTRLPNITFKYLIKSVEKLGFERIRQKGSHIRFKHPDSRKTTIPDHGSRDVPKGLLAKIIRYDLEMQTDEFDEILK
jgi:predicted RNA binding protein YcfA (HicA-like mRNA interferase family)